MWWNRKLKKEIEYLNQIVENRDTEIQNLRGRNQLKIELFKDKSRKWRFRILSLNYKILCSSEAYSRHCFAEKTAKLIRESNMCLVEEEGL